MGWISGMVAFGILPAAWAVLSAPPRCRWPMVVMLFGAWWYLHNAAAVVLLTWFALPVSVHGLSAFHLATAALLVPCVFIRSLRGTLRLGGFDRETQGLLIVGLGAALLLFPYTYLPGIDTYRWQDLASSIRMEGRIEWQHGVFSVLGFGPGRSYPVGHPAVLASLQILFGLSVDGAGYALSVLTAFCAACGVYEVARARGVEARLSVLAGVLFVLSPVFVRYAHWVTGRGVFLAFASVAFLIPGRTVPFRVRLIALLVCGLSHKVFIVALPLYVLAVWPGCALLRHRVPRLALAVAAGGVGLFFAGGDPGRALLMYGSRFGWLFPAVLWCLWRAPVTTTDRQAVRVALVGLALGTTPDAYGAMVVLPAVVLCSLRGLSCDSVPAQRLSGALGVLALALALGVLGVRWSGATPGSVRRAARFIEQADPLGPFMLEVRGGAQPERVRRQVQAYVSGCPRFLHVASSEARTVVRRPPFRPRTLADWQAFPRQMATWLRGVVGTEGMSVAHYGVAPRRHIVVLPGGDAPDATPDYEAEGIRVYLGWDP